jgi:hypothetical protein
VFYITTLSVAKIIQYSVSDRLAWSADGMLSTGENRSAVRKLFCSTAVSTATNPGRRPTAWSMAHGPGVKVRQNFSYCFLGWSLKYSYPFRTHLCKCATFLRTAQRYWHNLRVCVEFSVEEWMRPSEISLNWVKEGGWMYQNSKSYHYCVLQHGQLWVVLSHTTGDSCRYLCYGSSNCQVACSRCVILRRRASVVFTVYCDRTGVTIHSFLRLISGNRTIVAQFASSIER